ncbi:hypothetical protein CGLO_13914 [Colletotrichum gloeosporioides Cg-14]|uniref:Uncharacterized protein n=1 Tax=Colletotrichum gloeosporioides (strain Cg-14) TaxID=1237896 RepID=T0LFF7_COLGC|nr:hypothetical protein CGLO_13914 [Colletotrichum gloeosporioides Cg-14]
MQRGMWKSFLPNSRLSSQLSKDSMSLAIHHYQIWMKTINEAKVI